MADYSMDDEGWAKRKDKVTTYLEGHPDLGEMATVIQWNLNSGDEQPENRKRFWTNITTLFGMLPDSPISLPLMRRTPSLVKSCESTESQVEALMTVNPTITAFSSNR